MSDVFNEVDEQLRSARYQSLLERGWPYALGVVAALVIAGLGAWAWSGWQASRSAAASDAYAAGVEALTRNDAKAAEAKLEPLSRSAPAAYRTMALMQVAGLRLAEHKDATAVELLDQAARVAPGPVLGDAARLKAALVLMDDKPYAQVEPRLTPLTQAGRPYRILARQALGMAKLAGGAAAEAKGDLTVVSLSPDAADPDRARSRAMATLINDGVAKALPGMVKAAAALPPPPNAPLLPIAPAGAAAQ